MDKVQQLKDELPLAFKSACTVTIYACIFRNAVALVKSLPKCCSKQGNLFENAMQCGKWHVETRL